MPPLNVHRRLVAALAAGAWLACALAGFAWFHAYESRAGAAGRSPGSPPAAPVRGDGRPVVVMAVHPRCPCTRAGLATLAETVRHASRGPRVEVLVYRPRESPPDWAGPSAREAIAAVPGAVAMDDPGGELAARYGLATSGAVAVFDAAGRLRFAGGLNAGRGRSETSEGADALASLLAGRSPARGACDVYGCPLAARTSGGARP